jgi:hypothetical protein
MPTTSSKRHARKRNKNGSGNPTRSSVSHGGVDHVSDSAFLAERGILTQAESAKRPGAPTHHHTGKAA